MPLTSSNAAGSESRRASPKGIKADGRLRGLTRASAGELSLVVWIRERRQADPLSYHTGPGL